MNQIENLEELFKNKTAMLKFTRRLLKKYGESATLSYVVNQMKASSAPKKSFKINGVVKDYTAGYSDPDKIAAGFYQNAVLLDVEEKNNNVKACIGIDDKYIYGTFDNLDNVDIINMVKNIGRTVDVNVIYKHIESINEEKSIVKYIEGQDDNISFFADIT